MMERKLIKQQLVRESQAVYQSSLEALRDFVASKTNCLLSIPPTCPPRIGTEPGKIRPVVVIQTNSLNLIHPSTIVCPISTQVIPQSGLLRVHLKKNEAGLSRPSDVRVDQIRAIDNRQFVKKRGEISEKNKLHLLNNLNIAIMEDPARIVFQCARPSTTDFRQNLSRLLSDPRAACLQAP